MKSVEKPRATLSQALAALERAATARDRANLERFNIAAPKAFGVSMANMRAIAKRLGRDHDLAQALWTSGWNEARMLATLVDDPAQVTGAQMDAWCRDLDNWAIAGQAECKIESGSGQGGPAAGGLS